MTTIRVNKEFNFEMAHALHNYDGLCKNIHGHSYKLFVCLKGQALKQKGHPKDGMLIDFKDLKKIVQEHIVSPFDHALVLNSDDELNTTRIKDFSKTIVLDFQPTCENLCIYFAELLSTKFKKGVQLTYLKLYETESSYCEWHADDQK
jgi:6-pyruvoyltetrahydropterin/6-carboxytetrahydropterin synthase